MLVRSKFRAEILVGHMQYIFLSGEVEKNLFILLNTLNSFPKNISLVPITIISSQNTECSPQKRRFWPKRGGFGEAALA